MYQTPQPEIQKVKGTSDEIAAAFLCLGLVR